MEHIVQLNKKYRISSDGIQLTLQQSRVINKKGSKNYGKTLWNEVSFHSNFKSLLNKLAWKELLENWGDFEAVNKALSEIKEIAGKIDDKINF